MEGDRDRNREKDRKREKETDRETKRNREKEGRIKHRKQLLSINY